VLIYTFMFNTSVPLCVFLSLCLSLHLPIYTSSYFSIFLSLPHTIFLSMKEKNCVHLCGCSSPKTQHSRKHFHRSLCLSVFLSFYHSVSLSLSLSVSPSLHLSIFTYFYLSVFQPINPSIHNLSITPCFHLSLFLSPQPFYQYIYYTDKICNSLTAIQYVRPPPYNDRISTYIRCKLCA